ncbi:MAG: hypothetical protein KBD16_02745 [Candidatus Pacebacteria bacterium]|nr:hypothetical protein [Candidatus Paceibacterota bacterium]
MFEVMKRHLKNYLIPHPGNNNRPHLLREAGAVFLALVVIGVFGFSLFRGLVINRSSDFTAAVLPIVLVNITNNDRGDEGLTELTVNPLLEEAARMKAEHMAEYSYFAHISPDGIDPWYWFYRAGYTFTEAGENLAVNFVDSEDVVKAWMDSPGHRANILNGKFTEIGIAAVKGEYKGKKTIFVVQMFGTPAQIAHVSPTPSATLAIAEPEAPVSEPSVAGVSVETLPAAPVALPAVEESPTTLVKEDTKAYVVGALPAAPVVAGEQKSVLPFESLSARPRAVVSWAYLLIGLLIAFVILLMVFKRVHHEHPRSVVYGCALLVLITMLSYFNWLLLSADLVIV